MRTLPGVSPDLSLPGWRQTTEIVFNSFAADVLAYIGSHPGVRFTAIQSGLKRNRSMVHDSLKRLLDAKLISVHVSAGSRSYTAT